MFRVHAGVVGYAILAVYFAVVLGIGQAPGPHRPRLLPVRPLAAGLDHRAGVHRRQPGRPGDPRAGRQRRQVRGRHRALLLDRGHPGDGVPGHRDDLLRDAVLLGVMAMSHLAVVIWQTRDPRFCLLYGLLYLTLLIPIRLYALMTTRNSSWGTRRLLKNQPDLVRP
jgi:hypothetical protein